MSNSPCPDPVPGAPGLSLLDRVHFAATCFRDRHDAPWRVRAYQLRSLCSEAPRKVHCDGRDVGKTTEIEIIASWAALARPDAQMLVAAPTENHLFPLMGRLARRFETTPELAGSLVEIRRSPSWHLRFSNGFQLWGRIPGPRGVNFQGMHVDWQVVDEAQELTETGWGELFQSLNGGGMRWVYGVPNGLRNTFHRMTRLRDAEQYNWPSHLNPDFSRAKDRELQRLYGGPDSPGYLHRVLGRHGAPMRAVFCLDDYLACVDPGLAHHNLCLRADDDFLAPEQVPPGDYYLGCDLGYARDPSEFVVYLDAPPHRVNVLRLRLEGVNYARQQAVIEELDRAYAFRAIGIDAGNSGRAVAHQLLARHPGWAERLHAFEFGGTLAVAPAPGAPGVRRRVKDFMTEIIQRALAERSLVFPPIADRESEYAAHTYHTGPGGRITYEKGNDHLIDADRCALLAHHQHTGAVDAAPERRPAVVLRF
jgi:hypothetical protein